ncbi:MAG TPA: hypothetical protein DIT55_07270, partial [Spirochaetaceae bacterium]|nr:hypothetical protein [Spirochaetaceae bacterium]
VTPALLREGYVRDLIRGLQNLRKESGFEVTDRIAVLLNGDAELREACEEFRVLIAGETLAESIEWTNSPAAEAVTIDAGEKICRAVITRT